MASEDQNGSESLESAERGLPSITVDESGKEPGEELTGAYSYPIRQEVFHGPLGKLLQLVREHEIDIFQVSLATIADEFHAYVVSLENPDLDEVGDYLVIAGQLLVMKSRGLLPTETQEDEEEEVDEQALLLERLRDYERFKEIAELLREAENRRRQLYLREKLPPGVGQREEIEFYEVNVYDLATAFQRVLSEIGDDQPSVIRGDEYTIDEKMVEIQLLLQETGEMCLTLYLESLGSRLEIIVTFLALLELMRLLKVKARQASGFGDIWIFRAEELGSDDEGDPEAAISSSQSGFLGPARGEEEGRNEEPNDDISQGEEDD